MHNPKRLISLDILRGIACFLVLISHIRVATHYFKDARYDFIQIFTAWGREAVIIFFILSGIVINITAQNKNAVQYIKKRFFRIYPIYFVVLVLCFSANYFIFNNGLDTKTLIGNLLLTSSLSGYPVPTMPLNPAVWSISCEAFFYLVFGMLFKANRLISTWLWFILSVISIAATALFGLDRSVLSVICFMLNSSFLWLLGYLIFEYRRYFQSSLPVAFCGILMIPMLTRLHQLPQHIFEIGYCVTGIYLIPLFTYLLRNFSKTTSKLPQPQYQIKHIYLLLLYPFNLWVLWQYSNSTLSNKLLYSLLPLVSLTFYFKPMVSGLRYLYLKTQRLFTFLADISYPLYLLHMPIMFIAFHYLPTQKLTGMGLAIVSALAISSFLETYLFKKPALAMKLSRNAK